MKKKKNFRANKYQQKASKQIMFIAQAYFLPIHISSKFFKQALPHLPPLGKKPLTHTYT